MSSKENLRPLKILVFSMGLLLVGGTVLLFGIAIKKMSAENNPPVVTCKGGAVDLKGRGVITESQQDGNILRLTLEKSPRQTEIVTIDSCTGEITGALSVESDTVSVLE